MCRIRFVSACARQHLSPLQAAQRRTAVIAIVVLSIAWMAVAMIFLIATVEP
jgi:hypothetical protein